MKTHYCSEWKFEYAPYIVIFDILHEYSFVSSRGQYSAHENYVSGKRMKIGVWDNLGTRLSDALVHQFSN